MKASKKTTPKNVEELFLTKNKRLLDPFSVIPLIPIQPDHLVGDIGCGSGYLTDVLKSTFDLVVGTDISFTTLLEQNYKTQTAICCNSACL